MNKILAAGLVTLTVFVLALSAPFIWGVLTSSLTITNVGIITKDGEGSSTSVNAKAYWDSSCTNEVITITWGNVEPGTTKNFEIYLRNEGDTPITLSLDTSNWSPINASRYISLSWNYPGNKVAVGTVIKVTLILSVASSISGISTFTFNVVITATQA